MAPRKANDSGCCSTSFLKYVLHVFNTILMISGLIFLGIGIWTIIEKYQIISLLKNPIYVSVTYTYVATGSLILLIVLLGCCAVCREKRPLIICYLFLLLIILILEVLVGVTCFFYRERLSDELQETLNSTFLEDYGIDPSKTKAIDYVQQNFKCCGAVRFEDWEYSEWYKQNLTKFPTPDSCCKTMSVQCAKSTSPSNIYYSGCQDHLEYKMKSHLNILSAIGLGICVIQVFGIIFSCCLFCKLRRRVK